MPQTVADPDLTRLVMTVVQAGDAPGGGGQLPEFPGGGGGGQGAGPPPTLLPSQRSFHPLPATECHRSSGWQNKKLVFRIRIHMFFLGFPDPDPFVRGMDPDPFIIKFFLGVLKVNEEINRIRIY